MATPQIQHTEEEFIFDKRMTCLVCDKQFKTKVMKSNRARRKGSDMDLRPRFEHIDTLKYMVCSCPHCGYSAMHSTFSHIASRQIKNIREQVCVNFTPEDRSECTCYTYDQALHMYELALQCADAKLAKNGEKAYLHLVMAWLYREKKALAEQQEDASMSAEELEKCSQLADEHYLAAYEGFEQAMMNEMPPIMGLDQATVEYLIAYMAYYFGKLEVSAKLVGSVLTTSSASRNVKERALELKDEIVKALKERKK